MVALTVIEVVFLQSFLWQVLHFGGGGGIDTAQNGSLNFHLLSQMMKVKHWMTEVLLDVTSEEITKIAHSVYDKAKAQALKGRFCLSCQKGHSALVHEKFQFWKKTFCLLEQTCWKSVCFCLGGCIDEGNQRSCCCCCWSAFYIFLQLCQFLFFHLKLWRFFFW